MAGAGVVVVADGTDLSGAGEPVEPNREPAGAPMAGAGVVVVVDDSAGAGTVTDGPLVGTDVVVGDGAASVTGTVVVTGT
jgi:hypothetical protein